MRTFKVSERKAGEGIREIVVEGELDLAVAPHLQEVLDRLSEEDAEIFIRLDKCEFIDSTGIAVILAARNRLTKNGGRLVICDPSAQVHRILSVTGLTGNGLVVNGAEEALAGETEGS